MRLILIFMNIMKRKVDANGYNYILFRVDVYTFE